MKNETTRSEAERRYAAAHLAQSPNKDLLAALAIDKDIVVAYPDTPEAGYPWYRLARKFVITVVGFSVFAFGMALVFTPGPAILVLPLGLAILATEFCWARKLLGPFRKIARRLQVVILAVVRPPPVALVNPQSKKRTSRQIKTCSAQDS